MNEQNKNLVKYFNHKSVLITGAGGFIGSHLVESTCEIGAKVKALVHYNSRNDWGNIELINLKIKDNIEIVSGDIRDSNFMRSAIKGVDIVFHLAALIGIPYSYYSPDAYVDTNIKGTLNILQAAKDFDIERVLTTSTSEVYGTAQYVPIDEKHPFQAQSPYSATKIGADRLAESFYKSFDTPITIVRPFNAYGPRQSARAIIPTIIIQLLNEREKIKLGSLNTTRDFNFVEDICRAYLMISANADTLGEEVNIASQNEISMGDLAKKIIDMINPNARIIKDTHRVRPQNSEVDRLCGNAQKLRHLVGWLPQVNFEEGLTRTIEWFKTSGILDRYKDNIYNI